MVTISHSEIRCFKECRQKHFFAYREGLKPTTIAEALETGSAYHDKLEQLIQTGSFEPTNDVTDAMARAWARHIMPRLELKDKAERFFEVMLADDVRLIGYVDAECVDGLQIEHKTTSAAIDEKYIHRLAWDDQVPTYLIASGNLSMWYTVCRKPTIRQTQKETWEQYLERCDEWYETDTESKIGIIRVHRTAEDIAERKAEIIAIAREIAGNPLVYRNPSACSVFSCPYESICLNYDPKHVIGFERRESRESRTGF